MAYKRGEGKNNCDYSTSSLYKEYKKSVKDSVPYVLYVKFIKEYNERIISAVIYDALEYRMPYRLGYLRIQKRKLVPYIVDDKVITKHISIDWKRTLDSWRKKSPGLTDEEIKLIPNKKVLLQRNEHSNGFSVRFLWDKRYSVAVNQSSYIFKATRTAKEELARFIKKTGIVDYFE